MEGMIWFFCFAVLIECSHATSVASTASTAITCDNGVEINLNQSVAFGSTFITCEELISYGSYYATLVQAYCCGSSSVYTSSTANPTNSGHRSHQLMFLLLLFILCHSRTNLCVCMCVQIVIYCLALSLKIPTLLGR